MDVEAVVRANTHLSDEYCVVVLEAPAVAAAAAAGQFVMIKPARGTDPLLRRPFSVFEIITDSTGQPTGISLLNKKVGVGTALLYDARPGQQLPCLGPLGRPFTVVGADTDAWMVAGGVGLAPFAALASVLRDRGVATTLFYGGRRADDLYCLDRFERLGVRLVLATENGSRGRHGFVTDPLADALAARADPGPLQLYACGPTPMMSAVAELAASHAWPLEVSLEQVMGCGMGGCYSCVVKARQGGAPHYVRSCLEGPVFDAADVVWAELV